MIELTETMNDLKKNLKQKELQLMPSIGKNISDFCYDHSIKNVIFLDRSARPAYQTLKETWRQNYKDEIRPNIYFISPKIMENVGVDDEGVKLFKKEQPYLAENKQATLIFDVCVKSGLTLYNMTKLLEKSDFKEVYSMVTARHIDEKLHFAPTKIIFDNEHIGCHIFGKFFNKDIGIKRDDYSLLSQIDKTTNNVRSNRIELKNATRNYL